MRCAVMGLIGCVLASLGIAPPLLAAAPAPAAQVYPVQGVVIVKFREYPSVSASKTGLQRVDKALAAHGVESVEPIAPDIPPPSKPGGTDLTRVFLVRYASGVAPRFVAAELRRLPEVEYAEEQRVYPLAVVPNDNLWILQDDYLLQMRFDLAWDQVKGEQGDVVIAMVDGGTDWRHLDLEANVWTNPGEIADNGVDDDNNGFVDDVHGWNFANDSNDPTGLPATINSARHGTHTAGIACAVANNARDIAGATWNAKVMPLNAASPTTDNAIQFGYQGILYAAANGADIINCSWGGQVSPSAFELDVIDFAEEQGAAIVAAAGNNGNIDPHYPSSYRKVLSVANVTNTDVLNGGSNFGPDIDVCAQGTFIRSLYPGNTTAALTGTSMSSPHAASVAALVKTLFPNLLPQQVLQQVRATCDDISSVNVGYDGLLGKGRVNALRALTIDQPAIRLESVAVETPDNDGVIEAGEEIRIRVTVKNYLAAATTLSFSISESSNFATIVDGSSQLASIGMLESVTLEPFVVTIAGSTQPQTTIPFALSIGAASPLYTDRDRFEIVVSPVFVNHVANNVQTSVTSNGRLGFAVTLGGNGTDGIGFKYKGGPNLLFEGALMMGDGATRVVDAARGASTSAPPDAEFATAEGGVPAIRLSGADEMSSAQFNDNPAIARFNLTAIQQGFQFASAPDDDYIVLRYTITNNGTTSWNNTYLGWYFDWDVDSTNYGTNRTGYDATRGLGYVWDENGAANGAYAGVKVLSTPGTTSYRGIFNDDADPANPTGWGVYDGFSASEKWTTLSGGIAHTSLGPADISNAIATGPFNGIAPGQSFQAALAILAGDNLDDLKANADAAQAKWAEIQSVPVAVEILDLAAVFEGADVVVSWRTQREEDVVGFRVLRQDDDGSVEAVGGDVSPNPWQQYAIRDVAPERGHYLYRVAELTRDGSIVVHAGVEIEVLGGAPRRTFLAQAQPNPFNPATSMQYGLASPGPVRLGIYDARGRRVRTLVHEAFATPGNYQASWNGLDDSGRKVASGVYHARLEVTGRVFTQRLTLVK